MLVRNIVSPISWILPCESKKTKEKKKKQLRCGQWLPREGGTWGEKWGSALLLCVMRFMIPRSSQSHSRYSASQGVSFTTSTLSYKALTLVLKLSFGFCFPCEQLSTVMKEPSSSHLQSVNCWQVPYGFFSRSTCGLTVYTSDNLLHHAAWAINPFSECDISRFH